MIIRYRCSTLNNLIKAMAPALLAFYLAGCGEKSVEVKTVQYYKDHVVDAKATLEKCKEISANELSALSPAKRIVWSESPIGINCENSRKAVAEQSYEEYQAEMKKAADKY